MTNKYYLKMVKKIEDVRINRLKKISHKSFHDKFSEYRCRNYCEKNNRVLNDIKKSVMPKFSRIGKKTSKKLKIILYSDFFYGFGDILFLNKLANMLYRYTKQNNFKIQIVITFDKTLLKKFYSVASKIISSLYIPIEDLQLELTRNNKSSTNLLIQVATPRPSLRLLNCKNMYIDEYNGSRSIDFGFYFENNGINIVSGIGNNLYSDCCGIIFETFENEYITLKNKYKNNIVDELEDYFFVYNSSAQLDEVKYFHEIKYFFDIVVSYYKKKNFLVIWKLSDEEIMENFKKIFLKPDSRVCYSSKNIKIIKIVGDYTKEFIIQKSGSSKIEDNITIFLVDFLHPIQFTYALKKSNDLVMITGDQSLSEAIKFNKLIIYQCQEWKINLFEQYLIFIDFVLGKKSLLYNFVYQQYDKFIFSDNKEIKSKIPTINIDYLLDNMDILKSEIKIVNKLLYKNYNIEDILLNQIKLLL